jgi:hypothetical protein
MTNPDSNGNVISITQIEHRFTLRGCLRTILRINKKNIPCGFYSVTTTYSQAVSGVRPFDIMPGGTMPGLAGNLTDKSSIDFHSFNFLELFGYQYSIDPATGSVSFNGRLGFLSPQYYSFSATSQVANFDFIPMESALDYQAPSSSFTLDHDILHDNINTTLSRTPFDLIVGETSFPSFFPRFGEFGGENFQHLNVRNDLIGGFDEETWLSREIGDNSMSLENSDINTTALFDAVDDIDAGIKESKFYDYPSKTASPHLTFGGLFSKESGFTVDGSGGNVEFKAGHEVRLDPGFSAQAGCRFLAHIASVDSCNYSFSELAASAPVVLTGIAAAGDAPSIPGPFVFPNPSGNTFIVKAVVGNGLRGTLQLYNTMGELVDNVQLKGESEYAIDASKYRLNSGMYILIIRNNDEIYSTKLLLNR